MPGEPRKVKLEAVNSTSINVQWRPPMDKEQNGVIRGFQIHYSRLDESDDVVGAAQMHDIMDGALWPYTCAALIFIVISFRLINHVRPLFLLLP